MGDPIRIPREDLDLLAERTPSGALGHVLAQGADVADQRVNVTVDQGVTLLAPASAVASVTVAPATSDRAPNARASAVPG